MRTWFPVRTVAWGVGPAIQVAAALLCILGRVVAAEDCSDPGAALEVGTGSARPGQRVEVQITGRVACPITGFSLAVGHDMARLRFIEGRPSAFLAEYAKGGPLFFMAGEMNAKGYGKILALFDMSFPLTVPPTALPERTDLAVLVYEVLPDAAPGTTVLLNRHRQFEDFSNIFSAPAGAPPIEPTLVDGTVEVLPSSVAGDFLRGDSNGDRQIDITDVISVLGFLFQGASAPWCSDAADANDDGEIDISDAVRILVWLFLRDGELPAPFAAGPGQDPTIDGLGDCPVR